MAAAVAGQKAFDVVMFGATGFTGRLVAAALLQRGAGLKLGFAGRNLDKLKGVLASIPGGEKASVIKADSNDAESIQSMVQSTRVVATTVGPFDKYGEGVVAACAQHGTDYVDITGETWWVDRMQSTYSTAARASGAIIVSLCGVDSIPSDLAAMLAAREAGRALGTGVSSSVAYFLGDGGISGGTIASAAGALMDGEKGAAAMDPAVCTRHGLPPATNAPPAECIGGGAPAPGITSLPEGAADVPPTSFLAPLTAWESFANDTPLLPMWDATVGVWRAPFIMAGVNSRVVRRSAVLHGVAGVPYGILPGAPEDGPTVLPYLYGEYIGLSSWFAAAALSLGTALMGLLLALPPTRWLLLTYVLPAPGQGPDAATLASGWHRVVHVATPAGETGNKRVVATWQGEEPGYTATGKMLAGCAMLLARQRAQLPGVTVHGGGFLTPASAFGTKLVDVLTASGDFAASVQVMDASPQALAPYMQFSKVPEDLKAVPGAIPAALLR